MSKPGMIIYLDILPSLEEFTEAEVGQVFLAMLRYGTTGEIPEFEDRTLRIIWKLLQPRIDKDDEAYNRKIMQKKYAVYCRYQKMAGITPLTMAEWEKEIIDMAKYVESRDTKGGAEDGRAEDVCEEDNRQ